MTPAMHAEKMIKYKCCILRIELYIVEGISIGVCIINLKDIINFTYYAACGLWTLVSK